ncbi:MAG: flap endonuclease [Acidimicrobiia bacterium]|nr:flap endonuclease [Acidimicrobiia bacterium]MBJ7380993.1 flap endonuclease [Acidimicrobiia bacterium]MBJ7513551.1 flap endonuclease [Acidimicrobiia bacterium]
MEVHLLDGTYELFRHHFALPSSIDAEGVEIAAVRGVLNSVVTMLDEGVTHIAVATDHTVDSFRNAMYAGYKTGEGLEEELFLQFAILEDALSSLGVCVLAMTEYEADDAMASAARIAGNDERVSRVHLCTPDKDLSQCVEGDRIVQVDRRRGEIRNADGVRAKFGVSPESIPDWLALTGDTADGFPGLKGWGAKSSALVLEEYLHLENIPRDPSQWTVQVRGASRLAETLDACFEDALLFRDLATLRYDAISSGVDDWVWTGPRSDFQNWCDRLGLGRLSQRVDHILQRR